AARADRAFRSRGSRRVRGVAAGDRTRRPEGARRDALGAGSPHPHDRRGRHGRAASRRELVPALGRRRGPRPPRGEGVKDISPQLQNQIAQYQQLQNQLQVLASQRVQLEAKLREIEATLEELNKLKGDTPVYKSIGMLLVRQDDREGLKKELEEHKETLTIRVKSLQKQEKSLSERYEDLAGKIQAALGTSPATAEGN